jgi:thiol-disulfide isomerase/thioredoxin
MAGADASRALRGLVTAAVVWIAAWTSPAAQPAARPVTLVSQVRQAISDGNLPKAEALVAERRALQGNTPEVLAALSWVARGAQSEGKRDRAEALAAEAQTLAVAALGGRSIDVDANLVTAIGNAIEVQAQLGAERGERSEAIAFLERELQTYRDSSLAKRLQKNINLLTLEGHPAPPLDRSEWLGDAPPPPISALKGKVVIVFFWAHWCSDCKAEGPILARLLGRYEAEGLTLVAPTQRFGYVAGGKPAAPDEELRHIVSVRDQYYPWLAGRATPLAAANHQRYGVSSTPTLAIVDRAGIVRVYHPGLMTEAELEARIRALL